MADFNNFDGQETQFSEEVGDEGPLGKICGACGLMCLGFVLFPSCLFMLGWNEQSYVCKDKVILYSDTHATEVGCNSAVVPADTFAFFSCPFVSSTMQKFTPCLFNKDNGMQCGKFNYSVAIGNAFSFTSVAASQTVEMYQCTESCSTSKQKTNGQNKNVETCKYTPEWHGVLIDSSMFKRQDLAQQACPGYTGSNPQFPGNVDPGTSTDYAPPPVLVGDPNASYTLSADLVELLVPDTPVKLSQLPTQFQGTDMSTTSQQPPGIITLKNSIIQTMPGGADYITSCKNFWAGARIGCIRISYLATGATSPSVLASIDESGLTKKQEIPSSWLCSSTEFAAITQKTLQKDGLISDLRSENLTTVWVIRLIGILLAWAAVFCIFAPCATAADFVGDIFNFLPCCGGFIENFIEGVANFLICVLSCGIGCSCSLLVIGVVWIAMRPSFGIPLMIIGCCVCGCVVLGFSQFKDQGRKPPKGGFSRGPGGPPELFSDAEGGQFSDFSS